MVNRNQLFVIAVIAIALCSTSYADDGRTWLKYHESVVFGDDVLGEYSKFTTHDEILYPLIRKYLYQDEEGMLIVIRTVVIDETGAGMTTILAPDYGEIMHMELAEVAEEMQVTVHYGQNTITYTDEEELSAEVQADGAALISGASTEFLDGLERLAIVGSNYSIDMEHVGFFLRELFFPAMEPPATPPPADLTTEPTGIVKDFDPNTHPPTPFEIQFGGEYSLD